MGINWGESAIVPPAKQSGFEYGSHLRGFFKYQKKLTGLFDLAYRDELDERRLFSFRLGSYYKLHKNLKLGAFYERQYGKRHDEDWKKSDPATNSWDWVDTKSRGENLFIFDLTPRYSWGDYLAEIKLRYETNRSNSNSTLKVRPGISYFWFKDGIPFMSFFTQYEMYYALNFSDEQIYEKWLYLGALHHYHKHVKWGGYVAKRTVRWTDYPGFREQIPQTSYRNKVSTTVLGLLLILTL